MEAMKKDDVFEVKWEGQPNGLLQRFLTKIHMNFTHYQITKDELIITQGFFMKKQECCELYTLKDPDLKQNLYQQLLKIGTITVRVDAKENSIRAGKVIALKNIERPQEVRKLLRDSIEDDVMERGVTYFDKI